MKTDAMELIQCRERSIKLGISEATCIYCHTECHRYRVICLKDDCVNKWIKRHIDEYSKEGIYSADDFYTKFPEYKHIRGTNGIDDI